ncbi:MAG: TlpA family protein disulfide reductase [Deltaproteobacteria bacterium]|nr:TlpA family protein disulfide reductase [Deltaproteobacteria bacterium]
MKTIRSLAAVSFLFLVSCQSSKNPTITIGAPLPEFTIKLLTGETVTAADFKGKPLVMTFMAEWCPCSNDSAPAFKEAYSRYSPKGVEFLIIGFQDSEEKFRRFVERKGFPFRAAFDKGDKVGRSFGVNAPPTTFFISADGKVNDAFYGKIDDPQKLSVWIEEII